jgi:hypothetical protein
LRNISEFTKVYNKLLKLGSSEDESNANLIKVGSTQIGDALGELNESAIHHDNGESGNNNENNKENDNNISSKQENSIKFNFNSSKKEAQINKSKSEKIEKSDIKDSDKKEMQNIKNSAQNYSKTKKNLIESVPLNPTFADDKIGTCLELKEIWKFFRDYGIVGEDLTIADFDRIFYRGKKNAEEMFLIPEELPRRNIYKFLELMVRKSEEKFKSVHEKYIKFTQKEKNIYNKNISRKSLYGVNNVSGGKSIPLNKGKENIKKGNNDNNQNKDKDKDDISLYCEEDEENSELITFDFHNHHNPVLLRQFYEALIRAAYAKYYNSDMKLYQKIELLTSRFSTKGGGGKPGERSLIEKSKTKKLSRLQTKSLQNSLNITQNDINTSNVQMPVMGSDGNIILSLEQKQKNAEHVKIDAFILKFAVLIKPLFVKLYYVQKELNNFHKENAKINEQTLNHRFVFNNVVKKSELISKFYGKREQYCEFITYYFREKRIFFKTKLEQFKYYESLFDLDMVFYEFCEFIFLICSKYINANKLSQDDDKNYLEVINHLNQLIRGNKEFKNKIIIKRAKFNYTYPILKSHILKKIQEDEKIRLNQINLIDRIEKVRYNQERNNLKENDENMNPKEEEDLNPVNTQEEDENTDEY